MKIQVTLMALLALGACKDKDDSGDAPKASKGSEAKHSALKLEKFGLQVDVPAGTKVSEMGEMLMVQGPGLVFSVDVPGEFSSKTLADKIEDAEMYSPLNMVKAEVGDGWDLTFENKGSMGTNYWVSVRRNIDGKAYNCDGNTQTKEQQAKALAACKTLRK